ncbi:hypothetical protein CDCA_CDCA13G3660 [Cyanidium caldarium]|uniref:Dol-P-Glc:Glc(2)Man(9)GlcNAc(2)-PP-Dol alpha-1,2-glucosyltransferase n=1 Tax=Cyanidium caldarium TaxID=2771 RepID=A0AAV9IZ70_CYACA|nr:hypothetical protein CDCA_CDCA13G3660 [Cyanidium caldarium]
MSEHATWRRRWGIVAGYGLWSAAIQIWSRLRQPKPYMDELLHVPACCQLCRRLVVGSEAAFPSDSLQRVTTPPGLYSLPVLLAWWSGTTTVCCAVGWLRWLGGVLPGAGVAYELVQWTDGDIAAVVSVLAFLPLAFVCQMFYTDAGALYWLLLSYRLHLRRRRYVSSAAAGVLSAWYRQSSIAWHAALAVWGAAQERGLRRRRLLLAHGTAGILYVVWLSMRWLRQSGTLYFGDAERHPLALHTANVMYYFAAWWVAGGGWSHLHSSENRASRRPRAKASRRHLLPWLLATTIAVAAVALGTRVHPFVLADNRHYTFAFYRHIILRQRWRRWALLPLYVISMITWWSQALPHRRLFEKLALLLALLTTLVPTALLEPRYFIPGVVLTEALAGSRPPPRRRWVRLRAAVNLLVAMAAFYVFFESPFPRPPDLHVPDDSPGRRMP